jgi:hypothetical protein
MLLHVCRAHDQRWRRRPSDICAIGLCSQQRGCGAVQNEARRRRPVDICLSADGCFFTIPGPARSSHGPGRWDEKFLTALIDDNLNGRELRSQGSRSHGNDGAGRSSFAEMTKKRIHRRTQITLLFLWRLNVVRYGGLVLRGQRRFIKPSSLLARRIGTICIRRYRQFET